MFKKHYSVDTTSTTKYGTHVGTRYVVEADSRVEAKAAAKRQAERDGKKMNSATIKKEW